ncbi:MAG: response regulator [Rhodocyclaceae bacterium]|nr:response regulator [Rhodocyclaceae bacterium]
MVPERNPTVLVVDDNDMMRALLRGILRQEAYHVVGEARDGGTALSQTERLRPDVVCLDVVMPNTDGLETLRSIKAQWPETVVLMITANSDRDTVEAAITAGASGYVVKPFNAGRVLATLQRAVAHLRKPARGA